MKKCNNSILIYPLFFGGWVALLLIYTLLYISPFIILPFIDVPKNIERISNNNVGENLKNRDPTSIIRVPPRVFGGGRSGRVVRLRLDSDKTSHAAIGYD